jgi:hypothetical protein
MRKTIFSLITTIIFLVVTLRVYGQDRVEAPTYQDGECWQFNVTERDFIGQGSNALGGLYEICNQEGKFKVFEFSNSQKTPFSAGAAPLLAMLNQGTYQGGKHLEFPLYVGSKWNFEYKTRLIGARTDMRRLAEVKVVGIEDVVTSAGKCRAFKITREDSTGGPRSGWLFTYFYCPDTKSIVKAMFDFSIGTGSGGKREIELVKFGSAR